MAASNWRVLLALAIKIGVFLYFDCKEKRIPEKGQTTASKMVKFERAKIALCGQLNVLPNEIISNGMTKMRIFIVFATPFRLATGAQMNEERMLVSFRCLPL